MDMDANGLVVDSELFGNKRECNAHSRCIYDLRISFEHKKDHTADAVWSFLVIRRRFELRTHCLKGSCSAN